MDCFININNWGKPLTIYNLYKNIFKKPKCVFRHWNYPHRFNYGKIFDLVISDVEYKMKYDDPRHEQDPFIRLTLFNKWQFEWSWEYEDSDICWEAILTFHIYGLSKALTDLMCDNYWTRNGKRLPYEKQVIRDNIKLGEIKSRYGVDE